MCGRNETELEIQSGHTPQPLTKNATPLKRLLIASTIIGESYGNLGLTTINLLHFVLRMRKSSVVIATVNLVMVALGPQVEGSQPPSHYAWAKNLEILIQTALVFRFRM